MANLNYSDIYTNKGAPNAKVNPKIVGAVWFDYETGITYTCKDNTLNKNVWVKCCRSREELDKYLEEWAASHKPPEGGSVVPGTNYTDEGLMDFIGVDGVNYRGILIGWYQPHGIYRCCHGCFLGVHNGTFMAGMVGNGGNIWYLAAFDGNRLVNVLQETGKTSYTPAPQHASSSNWGDPQGVLCYDPNDNSQYLDPLGRKWTTPYVPEWNCDYISHGVNLYLNNSGQSWRNLKIHIGLSHIRSYEEVINFKPNAGPGIYTYNSAAPHYLYRYSSNGVCYTGTYIGSNYDLSIGYLLILEKG